MTEIFPIVVQEWIESERGWGCRLDGYSIHLSEKDRTEFVNNFIAEERKRNPSEVVPDCYSRPNGNSFIKDVEGQTYEKIKEIKSNGGLGYWIQSLQEIETQEEKLLREKSELERNKKIEQERTRKETIKKTALSKLTKEEKEVLGLKS